MKSMTKPPNWKQLYQEHLIPFSMGLHMFPAALSVYGIRNWSSNWLPISPSPPGTASLSLSSLATKIGKYKKMKSLTEPPNWKQLYQEHIIPLSMGLNMFPAALSVYGIRNWSSNWLPISPSPSGTASLSLFSLARKIVKYRKIKSLTEPPNWKQLYQGHFSPFTKHELLQHLLQDFHCTLSEESAFRDFACQMDFHILNQYNHVLTQMQELYHSFEPNPDSLNQPPHSDLQRQHKVQKVFSILEPLLNQANFSLLLEEVVAFSLATQHPQDIVKVRIDLDQYAFIRFWAPGQCKGRISNKGITDFYNKLPSGERHYFKRVVLVAQTKEGQMVLKSFKDTPLDCLGYLFPRVKTQLPKFQLVLLDFMVVMSGLVAFINVGMEAASYLHMATSLLLLLFIAIMGHQTFRIISHQCRLDNLNVIHLLYYLTASINSELIPTLVQRAQEEHTKEVLLASSFLRRMEDVPSEDRAHWLKKNVESWLLMRLGREVNFNGERVLEHHNVIPANMALGPLTSLFNKPNPPLDASGPQIPEPSSDPACQRISHLSPHNPSPAVLSSCDQGLHSRPRMKK